MVGIRNGTVLLELCIAGLVGSQLVTWETAK